MDALLTSLLEMIAKQGPVLAVIVAAMIAVGKKWIRLGREYDAIETDRNFYRDKYFEGAATARSATNTSKDLVGALGVIEDLADRLKP